MRVRDKALSKMNKQQSETKHTTLSRRVSIRKRKWLVGVTAMTIIAGITATAVLDFSKQRSLKNAKTVTPAHVTVNNKLAQAALINNYAQLPLQFEQNRGQTNDEVEYVSRGSGYTLFLTPTETVLTLQRSSGKQNEQAVVRTSFVNANVPVVFNGNNVLPGKVNYLIGRDESKWLTDIPTYTDVIAKEIYPGIDLRYHGDQRQLEYDFIVAPGVNTDDIQLQFSGVDLLRIGEEGQLVIETAQGTLQHKKPIVYQDISGERITVEGNYLLSENKIVSFKLGQYDPNHELIIDPILDYSTYLGGEADDRGLAIAVDDAGNAYVAGTTVSASFPVVNAYQTSLSGSKDTFIAKLNANGDALVYATYFGGSGDEDDDDDDDSDDDYGEDDEDDNDEGDSDKDTGKDITVDANGYLYITGSTNSDTDFPIVNAVQSTYGGGDRDAYVAKLSVDGSSLLFSTYLGGSNKDKGFGIALSNNGNVFVTGKTKSNNFPTTANAYQTSHAGNGDAYVVQLAGDGSQLNYATYLGGSKSDNAKAIAIDSSGNAAITGVTKSKNDFPLHNALQPSFGGGGRDAYVAQLNASGNALNYSTYLGGAKKDKGRGITIDSHDNVIVVGLTKSKTDFPLVNSLQSTYGGGSDDGFISKLNSAGSGLTFSTYLGGEKTDRLNSVVVDSNDDIYVVGTTKSTNGIPTTDAEQAQLSGSKRDAFITKLSHDGSSVIYGTYLGGSKSDRGKDIAVDGQDAYITGVTKSDIDFPTLNALQPLFGGSNKDAFVVKIAEEVTNQDPEITSTPITDALAGQLYSYDVDATDADEDDVLVYNLQVFPTGMVIDTNTGLISWTPTVIGVVNVTVQVDDGNNGTATQSYSINVTDSDVIAPTITITSPQEGLNTNQANQTITGTLDETATLTLNGNLVAVNLDLSFSATVTLVEGVNSYTFEATDAATNFGAASLTLNLDTVLPVVTITSPQDGLVTNQTTQTIIGSLSEPATFTINGQAVTVNPDLSFSTNVILVEGANAITIEATDAVSNVGNAALTLNLDTEPPVITINAPQDGLITNQSAQTITGSLSETTTLTINGQTVTVNPDLTFSTDVTLVEGANSYTFEATDAATNLDAASLTLNLDTVLPVITITSPQDGLITNQTTQTIIGSLSEPATLTINGQAVTVNPDLSFSTNVILVEGANAITIEATDAASNVGNASLTLILDTVAPDITITDPLDGSLTNLVDQTITGNLDEIATLTFNTASVPVNPDNTFSVGPVALIEGGNTFTFEATDTAGNVSTQSITVTLDTIAPAITVNDPVDGSVTNQANQTITGSVDEAGAFRINGTAVTLNSDNTFSSDVLLVEGENTFTLEITDATMNVNTQTLTVTLDTVAAVITVVSPQEGLVTNQAAQTITGSINETASLTINGQAVSINPDNTYSFAVTLMEGVNSFTLEAIDTGTNTSTQNLTLNLDTITPVVTITNPADGLLSNNPSQLITGSVSEVASLTINGQAVSLNPDNSFSFGPITMAEGANTITAIATDAATNSTTTTINVSLDTVAPVISVTSPVDGALTNQSQIVVAGSLSEQGNLTINGQAITVNLDGSFSAIVSLVEGANTVTLTASDAATNVSQSVLTVNSDTIAPIINITTPINRSSTNQAAQLVTGSLSEAATLLINGQAVTVNPDLSFSFGPITLAEGANSISVSATDAATNNSAGNVSVTLDTVIPTLILDSPTGDILTNQSTVSFSGSVDETVSLTINGQAVTQNPDNTFSANVTVAEGSNVVDVVATDAGGNSVTQSINITIDTIAPSTPIISLTNRGNPLNGIVMVTGLPGAAEPGTLIHVINPVTNYEALVLAQSDGSFSTDVAGFANDIFSIITMDAAGNISAPVVLIPNPPLALTLDAIGNKTAPLGQITRFTVTANDSEGNVIALGLTPLPLPAGMEYNIATGEFSFRPTSGQEGDYNLTFSALSGDERVVENVTVNVSAPNAADPTDLTGRILDASSMQGGTIEPIVGATVSFLATGVSTTTDTQGFFTLSGLPANAEVFDIDTSTAQAGPGGTSYAGFREQFPLVINVTNIVERPFYLPRLAAESLTTVDPLVETIVNNPTLGIDLSIAAGNAINDSDGQPFTGQVSISEVPRNLAPANLPEFMDPTLLFTIQPVGVSYTVPAPITIANTEGHAPNSEVDLWSVDPDLGQFVIVGTGQVSADGSEIVTISGGIRANDWHAFQPPNPNTGGSGTNGKKPCPTCPEEDLTSTVSLNDGHMGTRHTLPAYRSLETSRALTFSYRTFRAYPSPSIPYNSAIDVRSTVPATVSYDLEVGGLKQGQEVFIDTSGFSEGLTEAFSTAISFDAAEFDSGMYDYRLKVTSNFNGGSRQSLIVEDVVMVVNEQQSPFGAGWMLEGLYSLRFNEDNSVTMIAPNGNSISYDATATPDLFDSPDSDYAVFNRNPDGSYTHTEKDGVKMHFNAEGQITEHEDRNNNITAYAYDVDGKLITITDPVGLITTFAYDINGLLETVTDPATRVTNFEYDATGNMTKVTYPDNTFETYEYDNRHLMTAHEDERQNRFTDRYDAFGRIIDGTLPDGTVRAGIGQNSAALIDVSSGVGTSVNPAPVMRPADVDGEYVDGRGNPSNKELDPQGRATLEMDEIGRMTLHTRDADSNPTQTTRPIGSVVTRTFDTFGNVLTQKEEFNTATTTYTYDPFSLVTTVTNPRNHTTTITRDPADGNPLTIVNELGHTTTMVYDSRGLVTSMTSPNGLVTTYTYNTEGLMDTKTETPPVSSPGNVRLWTYAYYPTGLLQTVNTPDGITLTYTYDDRSFLTSVTDNLNQSIIYTYDDHKNVTRTETRSSDGSLALLVDSIYDNRNRLTQTKAPHVGIEESITQRILDENSNLIGLIDPNGNPRSNVYDAFNRLDNNTHREGGITDYTYDDQDRITKVEAPNGVVTDYEYDIISRRTKEISPDRGTITYVYDLANNVTTITEGRGIVASMTYDELERVGTKTYPNTIIGKNENVTYTYDTCNFGLGFLCTRADESGTYDYNYDAYGNMTDGTFTEIEGTVYTMSYLYDDGDHIIQSTYPSGRVVDYARDGVRRVEAIDTTLNGTAQSIVSNIQYRGDNQITQCTFGNGLIDERSYDLQGRLTNQLLRDALNTLIDDRTYTYDKNSNVLNIATNVEDNAYLYDKLDRLTSDTIDNNTPFDFSYDLNDNRLTKNLQDLTLQEFFEQQENSNRISILETVQAGATPIDTTPNRDLIYNDVGRLYQLIEEGTLKAEYIYNDAGQRTRKTNYQADGITVDNITIYHYDHMGYLITETTELGDLIKDYIWQEGMTPVAQIDNNAGTESIVYLYTDHLMTNRLATDDTQAVVWRWEGEAFGNTAAQEISGVSVNLRFPGQYFDSETNLHYNMARYYDPQLGRYITSDPIGLNGGLNTYVYVNQNPILSSDPEGQASIGGVAATVVLAVGAAARLCSKFPKACNKALKCMRNPKLCRKKACNKVNRAMHKVCDSARSCKGGDSCMVIIRKAAHLSSCLAMRYAVRLCHGRNNDPRPTGHAQAIRETKGRIKDCWDKFKCCS